MMPTMSDPSLMITEAMDRPSLLVRRFSLTVTSGPDAGQSHRSEGARVQVGVDPAADVVLSDRTVSRFHCELAIEEGGVFLRDLGSRNGTRVDGVPVLAAPLRDGATLHVGRTELRFELLRSRVAVDLYPGDRFGLLVGHSHVMRTVMAVLARTAPTDVTVLVEGETGTGKEVAVESLHRASARKDGPLVVVDCGAIAPALIESELFGHERGAFTGADRARKGAFETASGGTLFLDEIGELSPDLQPKLLRVLETRTVQRVGGGEPIPVDVRIVAATNRNLRLEVNDKRFRADLLFRLNAVTVRLPPLRDRLDDLPLLVDEILSRLGAAARPEAAPLRAPEFLAELRRHTWSGNVRELRHHLERCLALKAAAPLEQQPDAPPPLDLDLPLGVVRERWIGYVERRYLAEQLARHGDNVTAAARAAGLDRTHLYRLLGRAGLR